MAVATLAIVGCGGNISTAPATTTSVAAVSSTREAVWQASLIDASPATSQRNVRGRVTIDGDNQSGNGTYQFSGQAMSAQYDVQYCYAPVSTATCHVMMTSTTDSDGAGSGIFVIPTSQPWLDGRPFETVTIAIAFQGTQTLIAAWSTSDATSVYSVPLFKTVGQGDQPPTSGRVTVNGGQAHITIRGATPNTKYTTSVVQQLGGAAGSSFGSLTTDGSGNADGDFAMATPGFGITLTPDAGGNLVDGVRTR